MYLMKAASTPPPNAAIARLRTTRGVPSVRVTCPMNTKLVSVAVLCVTVLVNSGCATRKTSSGGRETTVLGGVASVATDSFQPPTPATLDVDTSKLVSGGNPSGKKVTLFWGLITLHDY